MLKTKKDAIFKHTENNTTICHSNNLKSKTPNGKSKIFLFAQKHQSHFHAFANQTKSDQAPLKDSQSHLEEHFKAEGASWLTTSICNHPNKPKCVIEKPSVLHCPSELACNTAAMKKSVLQWHQVFLITVLHYGNNGQSRASPTGTL